MLVRHVQCCECGTSTRTFCVSLSTIHDPLLDYSTYSNHLIRHIDASDTPLPPSMRWPLRRSDHFLLIYGNVQMRELLKAHRSLCLLLNTEPRLDLHGSLRWHLQRWPESNLIMITCLINLHTIRIQRAERPHRAALVRVSVCGAFYCKGHGLIGHWRSIRSGSALFRIRAFGARLSSASMPLDGPSQPIVPCVPLRQMIVSERVRCVGPVRVRSRRRSKVTSASSARGRGACGAWRIHGPGATV